MNLRTWHFVRIIGCSGQGPVCFRGVPFQWIWEVGSYGCRWTQVHPAMLPMGVRRLLGTPRWIRSPCWSSCSKAVGWNYETRTKMYDVYDLSTSTTTCSHSIHVPSPEITMLSWFCESLSSLWSFAYQQNIRGFSEIASHLLPNPTTLMILGLPIGPGRVFPKAWKWGVAQYHQRMAKSSWKSPASGKHRGEFRYPKKICNRRFCGKVCFFSGWCSGFADRGWWNISYYWFLYPDMFVSIFRCADLVFGEELPPTDGGVQNRGWLRALFLWLMCLLELSNEYSIELLKIFKFFLNNNFRMVGWNSSPLGESLFFSKCVLPMSWSVNQNIVGCVWGTFFPPAHSSKWKTMGGLWTYRSQATWSAGNRSGAE